MPGMGTGINASNPTVVSAFYAALARQGLIVVAIALAALLVWLGLGALARRRGASASLTSAALPFTHGNGEPSPRRLLRLSFGLLWILDGALQAQASMPLGMAPGVIRPAAAASPSWVQTIDNAAATVWSYHPVVAPAAAVWIQGGLGLWLIVASRGRWSRLAGLASAAWGAVVWVTGEAFGQLFAPGLSWLFGAPGAVLFYVLAGLLVAAPDRWWATPKLGVWALRGMGAFFVGMAVLQAWPGRGFWQGKIGHAGGQGSLAGMLGLMSQTPQPGFLSSWVASFGDFDSAHGWAVNLFVVVALAAVGVAIASARPRWVKAGLGAAILLCIADWVLVEDLGFVGGVGTDPNSMIPIVLVLLAGYLALTRQPTPTPTAVLIPTAATHTPAAPSALPAGQEATTPGPPSSSSPPVLTGRRLAWRTLAAPAAVGITLVGVIPLALAAANPYADPILARAVDGSPRQVNLPAPQFSLVDQHGALVMPSEWRGKAVVVTFVDPKCRSRCPVRSQELVEVDRLLGAEAGKVELVALSADQGYDSAASAAAATRQLHLEGVANWHFLAGDDPALSAAWGALGAKVATGADGTETVSSEEAFVLTPSGQVRYELDTNPGPGSEATRSSFGVTLANTLRKALHAPAANPLTPCATCFAHYDGNP